MHRSLLALLIAFPTCLALDMPAGATGPGSWNHLGNGGASGTASLNGTVSALHKVGTVLYAGGVFTNAGGHANADRIARWDGVDWSALGTIPLGTGSVLAIAHYGGKIYAGGNFQNAGGDPDADNLAVFDGTSWAPFCDSPSHIGPTVDLQVLALQVVGTTLYVGGAFQNGAGLPGADYLLACDLTTGTPSSTVDNPNDFTGSVYSLTADTNGLLYAGGTFSNLDQIAAADGIASYDGTWHAVGSGVTGIVRAVAAQGTNVYVSTDMLDIGGLPRADHLAKWDGSAWSALGSNALGSSGSDGWFPASSYIYSITTSGSLVIATGTWQNASGLSRADNVAWFDGLGWQALGSNGATDGPWSGEGRALSVVNGLVYAGGNFTSAGGDPNARFVASRSLRLPDAVIGNHSGEVGDDIYSTTGAGQTTSMSIGRGSSRAFIVFVQNDGLVPASFTLKGTGTASGYTVTYLNYANGNNITTAMRNGTFATRTLVQGDIIELRMVVKLSQNADDKGKFWVSAHSTTGTPKDVVKGVVHAT